MMEEVLVCRHGSWTSTLKSGLSVYETMGLRPLLIITMRVELYLCFVVVLIQSAL